MFFQNDSSRFLLIELDETVSTNTYLADYHPPRAVEMTLVTSEFQTAGRGQRGNSWEASRGKNLLFSLLIYPSQVSASEMFVLSEAFALSVRDAVKACLPDGKALNVSVKWPNDIYVDDKKIAGILIENTLQGSHTDRCVIGCGLNVNQDTFYSDAPNPISLFQLTGQTHERRPILEDIVGAFMRRYEAIKNRQYQTIYDEYMDALYTRDGIHLYKDSAGSFEAEVAGVEPDGHLVLRDMQGKKRCYAFKEVALLSLKGEPECLYPRQPLHA